MDALHARREVALPLLVQAAGAFAGAAALALPNGLFAAAAALVVLATRGGGALLPFLLAGQFVGALVPTGARGEAALPAEIAVHATTRVANATRTTSTARHSTVVEFETLRERELAGAPTALLLESTGAPLRRPGDHLRVDGKLLPAGAPRNPGTRAERARLLADHVAQLPASSPLGRLRDAIDRLGNAIEARLHERLPPEAAALADALVLGRADELDPAFKDSLRAIGAWHFLAVSGSHVALVAALALALLAWLRLPERLRVPVMLLVVVGYAFLAGGEAPALRAVIGSFGAGLILGRRRLPSAASWLAAAFLLLCAFDPTVAAGAGLQLSFVAVLALTVAARYGPARSPKGTGRGIDLRAPLLRSGRYALAAGIATAPLTAWHFGSIAVLAPLATLLLGPIVTAALTVALVTAATTALPAACTRPCGWLLTGFDRVLKCAAHWGDQLPATPLHVATPARSVVALLVASWFALLARRPGIALALIAAALVAALPALVPGPAAPSLTLLAVGHGQSALLRDRGRCELFDAGSDGTLTPEMYVRALRELGVERLDGLHLSHLDADHAGLAPALFTAFSIGALWLPASARAEFERAADDAPAGTAAALRAAARAGAVPIRFLAAGDGHDAIDCLWPPPGRSFSRRNDGSLALRVTTTTGPTLLLPGDLEDYPLLELALRIETPATLLLLPHHGNSDPGLPALIGRLAPEIVLVSREERPLPRTTLVALRECGLPWLSTGAGGAIEWRPEAPFVRGGACR